MIVGREAWLQLLQAYRVHAKGRALRSSGVCLMRSCQHSSHSLC